MKHPMILVLALAAGLTLCAGCSDDATTQAPVPQDDAPPLPPTGLSTAIVEDGRTTLTWSPNVEPDLAGYRVYVYEPSPTRESAYALQNGDALLQSEEYAFAVPIGGSLWVRVSAVDQAGNESAAAGPLELIWENPAAGGSSTKPPEEVEQAPESGRTGRGGGTVESPQDPAGGGEIGTTPGDDPNQH